MNERKKCINKDQLITIFTSCNYGIPKEKLTVIENITLGGSESSINKQIDSLQIPQKRFFNRIIVENFNDLSNSNIYYSSHFTNLFNFNQFNIPKLSIEHLGLLTPVTLEGTENNFALIVLLCHTDEPWLWGDLEKFKNSINEKYVRLEVNDLVIEKIKEMYIAKYGEPKSVNTSSLNTFFMINGKSLSEEKNNSDPGVTIKWELEYYNITFFTGFDLNGIYNPEKGYSESTNGYRANIGDKRADPSANELHCSAYAYIYYQLNEKAMKELKTRNTKL